MRNQVLFGDALSTLKTLPAELVQVCITSPPYWGGVRDYGGLRQWFDAHPECEHDQQIVHQPHHPGQVEETKWKKAKASGQGQNVVTHSCSKCGGWFGQLGQEPTSEQYIQHLVEISRELRRVLRADGTFWLNIGDGYYGAAHQDGKPKDMVGMPWRLALALQADGWWIRSEVIWNKTNAKPESVEDRPARAHEHIFMLTKSPHYHYDHEAVLEYSSDLRQLDQGHRNRRDVWNIPYEPFEGAHFAVFPTEIPRVCILASTSPVACSACGAPQKRSEDAFEPSCQCGADTAPCVVLDPFCGSGTSLAVALKLKRNYLGIEADHSNEQLIASRMEEVGGLPTQHFAQKGVGRKKRAQKGDTELFDLVMGDHEAEEN